MEPSETGAFIHLAQRRFQSFSEAADSLLEALTGVTPGVVALGRLDPDEGIYRVIEARGSGVKGLCRGVGLTPADGAIDADSLRSLGAGDWLTAALEMSDGRTRGVLCAAVAESEVYRPEHRVQLGIAARLLSHEWESVELRSELRRLRRRLNAGPRTDVDTGLPNREGFLELLDREWRLAKRGTVQSVLIACRIDAGGSGNGNHENRSPDLREMLAVKIAAEVLEGSARETDRVGRIADSTIAAVLIGCRPQDASSFIDRYLSALQRATGNDRSRLRVACGVQSLDDASSPKEAVELAEAAAAEGAEAKHPASEGGTR